MDWVCCQNVTVTSNAAELPADMEQIILQPEITAAVFTVWSEAAEAVGCLRVSLAAAMAAIPLASRSSDRCRPKHRPEPLRFGNV